jgi:signal transduction histidine kinase
VAPKAIPGAAVPLLTVITASWSAAAYGGRRQAVAGLLAVWAAIGVVVVMDPERSIGDPFFVGLLGLASWLVGLVWNQRSREAVELEERAARAEREREERALAAVGEERARIARELHDVVAHSVSVMVVQAAGARRLLEPHQERQHEALLAVEQTGREALAEMRRMLGVMRRRDEQAARAPQPSLEHVELLVDQVRRAGLPVDLRVEGERLPLPSGLDLSAYRIVQEGLTNTLKHAGPARANVLVRYSDDAVELEVADDGRGEVNGDGLGQGLAGMRERVALYGGELVSGPRPGGGFLLRARLPLRERDD